MDESEEASNVRRSTRSAKPKTPTVKPARQKPGPLSRRTRKKVVLMEVEVSDEDEETQQEDKSAEDLEEKKAEEKLLESPEESNDATEKEKDTKASGGDEENHEVNGNGRKSDHVKIDDSLTVVINDIEMLEETEIESNSDDKHDKKEISEEKMEVDEAENVKPGLQTLKSEDIKKSAEEKPHTETKKEQQTETKKDPQTETKKDPQTETKKDPQTETKEEPKTETKKEESKNKTAEAEVPKKGPDTPKNEKSKPETPKGEPKMRTPKKDETKTSQKDEPEPKKPKKDDTPTKTPQKDEPEIKKPKKDEPETKSPQKDEPETKSPQKDEPETKSPKKDAPGTKSPKKDKPETKDESKKEIAKNTEEKKTEVKSKSATEEKPKQEIAKDKPPAEKPELKPSTDKADEEKPKEETLKKDLKEKKPEDENKEPKEGKEETLKESVKKEETKVKESVKKEETKVKEPVKKEETKVKEPVKKEGEATKVEEPKEEKPAEDKKPDEKSTVNEKIPEKKPDVTEAEEIKMEEKEIKKEEKEIKKEEKEIKKEEEEIKKVEKFDDSKQKGDPDAENISEDELPTIQAAKVPEAEEVSDEELPGPKRAELPADTEVVSEDELPTVKSEVKKEGVKRKLDAGDYDPGSPTSENEAPTKKASLEPSAEKDKEEKPAKPKKLPELDKYWKAVNDDPTDFTGWTYLLQYVDQENDMEAAREAYDAFLSHYPYCYGYWRKYADYEKRKGNKKKCEEVFERGLKAIPLSVDLWIHYLTYVKSTRADDEEFIRSQFERSIVACGLEFRSDRLWDSYIKWETEGKRLQKVTAIYDRLLMTPTQGYTSHFDNFQEHIASNPPNKVIEVDEFLALRKEVRHMLKHDVTTDTAADDGDAPPGDDDQSKVITTDEETKSIRERIVSIRRKLHKATVNAVTARWNYEEGIKRPYFHVKPLERCQLKNWQDYLDYETEQGDRVRIIVLFERCLIACALYEEFWLKLVHYLEGLKDPEVQPKIRDVYERACTIHHLKKPSLHLQWAMFEEEVGNPNRAAEILVNLEKSVPNILQVAYRRINLERRRSDFEKCCQLYEHYINNSKNKMVSSNVAIKYSRFSFRVMKDMAKAQEVLKTAITKDPNNPRLYLQLIDLTLQKENVTEAEVIEVIDSFLDKESTDIEQKVLFAQRKLEFVEDFGKDMQSVQQAYDQYQKVLKQGKDSIKKKETKSETPTSSKKEKAVTPSSSQSSTYNYGAYGNSSAAQPSYPYSSSQQGQNYYPQYGQGDQYQYQNWQYPQGSYSGYNQWGGYSGGYGY